MVRGLGSHVDHGRGLGSHIDHDAGFGYQKKSVMHLTFDSSATDISFPCFEVGTY